MAVDEFRQRGADFWSTAAPGWIRHADRQDRYAYPLGAAALEWLRITPGERVLDVGCAAGGTTAALARLAGPDGTAVGVDMSATMVDAARSRFPDLAFVAGDVETMGTVPGGPFDAAYSRMTVMLFADPLAGLSTIHSSLRPGGRFAATVFRDAPSTPWLQMVVLGAAPHVGTLPPLPIGAEPGPFAFADADRVRALLTSAGFVDVTVGAYDTGMEVADQPDAVAEWLIEVGPAGAAYRESSATDQAAARAGAAALLERFRDNGYRLPVGTWLLTGRRED